MKDFVVCKICNFIGKDIRPHIRLKHELLFDKYMKLFPNSKVISEFTIHKRALKNKIAHNKHHIKESKRSAMIKIRKERKWASYGMKGKQSWNKGLTKSNNEKVKQYSNKRNITYISRIKGKTYNQIYGDDKSLNIRLKQSLAIKKIMQDNNERIKRSINCPSKLNKGKKLYQIIGEQRSLIAREKMRIWHLNNPNPLKNSKGELEIKSFLESLNIDFQHDKGFEGFPKRPDFLFKTKKKIIEFNGCYWHNHSCMNTPLKQIKDVRIHDNYKSYKQKINYCKEHDIQVLEVWECEWNNSQNIQKQRIKEFIK